MHVESIESDDMLSVPVAFAAVRDLDRTHAAGKELSERRNDRPGTELPLVSSDQAAITRRSASFAEQAWCGSLGTVSVTNHHLPCGFILWRYSIARRSWCPS